MLDKFKVKLKDWFQVERKTLKNNFPVPQEEGKKPFGLIQKEMDSGNKWSTHSREQLKKVQPEFRELINTALRLYKYDFKVSNATPYWIKAYPTTEEARQNTFHLLNAFRSASIYHTIDLSYRESRLYLADSEDYNEYMDTIADGSEPGIFTAHNLQ